MSREYMNQQRIKSLDEHKRFQENCRNLFKTDRLSERCSQSTVSVTFANIVVNSSNDKLPTGQRIFGPLNINDEITHRYSKYNVGSCDALTTFHYGDGSDESGGCNSKLDVSMLNVKNDKWSSENLMKSDLRLKCEMFGYGDEENINFFVDTDLEVGLLEQATF